MGAMNYTRMLEQLQTAVPSLSALYVSGSQATGDAGPDSDLDLAVLADEALGPEKLWAAEQRAGRHGALPCGFAGLACLVYRDAIPHHHHRAAPVGQRQPGCLVREFYPEPENCPG